MRGLVVMHILVVKHVTPGNHSTAAFGRHFGMFLGRFPTGTVRVHEDASYECSATES